jgi:4-hydroxyphenylpyruvate dioxygenase
MKTSIATVSLSGDLREKLSAIAAADFDGVEIFENDFLAFDGSPRDVGAMVRDHGLEITLFQPFRDFEGLPEPQRARAFERARHKFELMNQLGTDLMLVCSNVLPASLGGIDRAAADFNALGDIAKEHGVRVGYEALAWGRHVNDHRDAWEIVRRADHSKVGLILDSFHTLSRGIQLDTIRSIPGDRIFIVQLADAPMMSMDLLYLSRHFRCMPGEGDLDVVGFMGAVAATGYGGPLSLEIFNDQFRGGLSRSIAVDGRRSLVNLMDRVRRIEPENAIAVTKMPDRIAIVGIEFVEFASFGDEATELEGALASLGFVKTSLHVHRDVAVWRQPEGGAINLVVNRCPEGFAHSSYLVHGTNAYAIGLRVADASDALERARALGAETFHETRGAGELSIPAVRGVGGGIIYFIDDALSAIWSLEFNQVEAPVSFGAGLTKVDHLAQSMNCDELLTWLLFYISIFRMTKSAIVDVVDPSGLVRSQVVESDGFRLTMNGAENSRTLAGKFIAENFGSAIQHLAFESENIFESARRMADLGFKPLRIPENYYNDLQARFGLDDGLLSQLRESNILYDREGEGEFFQFYSHPFAEGFFFEIVERRGGYNGYGGTNAPVRIAAQKRALRPKGVPRLV